MGAMTDRIKGKLMKAEGKATGDRVRQAQGSVEEGKGKLKGKVRRGVAKAKIKAKATELKVRGRVARAKMKRKARRVA